MSGPTHRHTKLPTVFDVGVDGEGVNKINPLSVGDLDSRELLEQILLNIQLLNLRIEEVLNTGIEAIDVDGEDDFNG